MVCHSVMSKGKHAIFAMAMIAGIIWNGLCGQWKKTRPLASQRLGPTLPALGYSLLLEMSPWVQSQQYHRVVGQEASGSLCWYNGPFGICGCFFQVLLFSGLGKVCHLPTVWYLFRTPILDSKSQLKETLQMKKSTQPMLASSSMDRAVSGRDMLLPQVIVRLTKSC